jgi:hypothetical protein
MEQVADLNFAGIRDALAALSAKVDQLEGDEDIDADQDQLDAIAASIEAIAVPTEADEAKE